MKEVSGPVIRRLAEMICGNEPVGRNFPYRSSSFLTQFFDDLWLDHQHNGTTRRYWVEQVLRLEAMDPVTDDGPVLTDNLRKIISYLVDPIHFGDDARQAAAIDDLNEVLSHDGLVVFYEPVNRVASVIDLADQGAHSGSDGPAPEITITGMAIVAPKAFDIPARRTLQHPQCGVLMPFGGLFDEIYDMDIAPAARAAGYEPLRANELWRDEKVMNDIVDLIFHSTVIVADLSERNPNVFYELGIAHLFGRTVVPIVQNPEDVPFDLRSHRYLEYGPTTDGRNQLRVKLQKRLEMLAPSS